MNIVESLQGWWDAYNPAILNFLLALAFLIGFYLVARLAKGVIRRILHRSTLDNRLAETIGADKNFPVENIIAGSVFWVIFTFGLLSFFDRLELEIVAQPINTLLTEILGYLPKLAAAVGLCIAAWIIASLVKYFINKLMELGKVDQRLQDLDDEEEKPVSVAQSLSTAAYWFVFLLFLPLILGALQMESLVRPLQDMFSEVFTYLPNIFSALLIFIIGSFVARIVRKVLTSLLAASGADNLSKKAGLQQSVSALVGTIAYTVILLLVIVQSLDALRIEAVSAPAKQMVEIIFTAVPGVLSAVLVIGISYFIGRMLSGLVSDLLTSAGFNQLITNIGMPIGGNLTASQRVGQLVLLAVILFAVLGATELVGFAPLSAIVTSLIEFAFQVVLAAVVMILGVLIANKAADVIKGVSAYASMAQFAKVAILILASAMALQQLGVADDIINLAFGILLGALGFGIALAIGLGSKEVAGKEVEAFIQRIKS